MAQRRQIQDRFFKQAKAEGYAARSAYKLKEIDQKKRVLRRGDRVLDLGCAPGSWMQVAAEIVGPKGVVVGIDLKPVTAPLPAHARAIEGDIYRTEASALMELAAAVAGGAARPFDAVLSDMAPSTEGGGGGSGDHFRSVDLCRRVLQLAPALLRPGGNLVMKVFEGEAYPDLLGETRRLFADVKGFKPQASRDVSREMFVVAHGLKGGSEGGAGSPESGKRPGPDRPGPSE